MKDTWGATLLIVGGAMLLFMVHCFVTPVWLFQHMANACDPFILSDDVRQFVWPFLKFHDPELFVADPIADYYLSAIFPQGFLHLMAWFAIRFDPRDVANLLPYFLLVLFTGIVTDTARRLGGWWAALGTLVLCIGTDYFLAQMTGGLARNFGLPLIALVAWSLVAGRIHVMAITTILSTGFYYVTAAIGGLSMAVLLLLFPSLWQGNTRSWNWIKRVTLLGITGLLCLTIFLPNVLNGRDYGPMILPSQYGIYPEAGPEGRYFPRINGIAREVWGRSTKPLYGRDAWIEKIFAWDSKHIIHKGILLLLLTFTALGLWPRRHDAPLQRLIILPIIAVAGYHAAAWAFPYLYYPQRYIIYVLPMVWVILLPTALINLPSFFRSAHRTETECRTGLTILVACLILSLLLSQRSPRAGLAVQVPEEERQVLTYLGTLPKDALIAGWPKGLMDNVPYVVGRRVLVNYETHLFFHQHYLEDRRIRLNALIDALYAVEIEPILRLREQFGVTHLVVHTKLLYEQIPEYFEPFRERIIQAAAQLKDAQPLLMQLHDRADFYQNGSFLIFDLGKIENHAVYKNMRGSKS